MIGFTKIVGGTASSVASLGEHLWNQTLAKRQADVAAYYHRGMDPGTAEAKINDFAPVLRTDMHPIAADGLGIDRQRDMTPAEVNGLIAGRNAQGGLIDGKKYAKVRDRGFDPKTGEHLTSTPIGSYDFCPSPDKSVSVAWAFAPPAEQALIYEAHISAAREAVAYIAKKIGVAHAETDGEVKFEPGHIGWMEFTHYTARRVQVTVEDGTTKVTQDAGQPGDPDVHTHFLIPNAVFCESGRVGSLHTGMIEGFIFEADGFYQMQLAQKLNDAGFTADLDPEKKSARMIAVPHEMTRLFSKRTNAAELIARQHAKSAGTDWDTLTDAQRTTRTRSAAHTLDQKIKGAKDDRADPESWKAQAKVFGWEPKTFLMQGPSAPELTDWQRNNIAYQASLQFLEKDFNHRSVLTHWSLRDAAARGCIHSGTRRGVTDIDAVTQIMRQEGVRQYGEMTDLVYGHEEGRRYVSVTTALHEDQEKEFIRLAQKLAGDKSWSVPKELIDKHIAASGLTFDGDHGAAQLKMIYRSAEAGRFSLGVAAAGAGKTTAWIPLIAAKKEMGHRVFGASLAWEQADDLVKAGIDPKDLRAFSVLLDDIPRMKLGPNDLVAVDEWALLGTRQGLQLLRLADMHGFGITTLGDPKQCNSVEAGNIVNLVKRALPDHVVEIETTIRQKDPEEKKFVGLLRRGEAKEAIDMKRAAGLAEMVPGDADRLISRTADLYMQWRTETGASPSVAAPTNIGAHKISLAIRAKAQQSGMVGKDATILRAGDNMGHHYGLALAPGDRIRLFKSTGARFVNGKGGNIGRNKSTLEVKSISEDGIMAKSTRTGNVGFVAWESLLATRGPSKGRFLVDYAYCKTINSAQGSDSDDHILALPYGSKEVTGLSGYSGATRQKNRLAILTSDVAERLEIVRRRPLNDERVIDLDAKWANVARNLSYQPEKDLAIDMLDRVESVRRGSVARFQKTMVSAEAAGHQTSGPAHATTPTSTDARDAVREITTQTPVSSMKPPQSNLGKELDQTAGLIIDGSMNFEDAVEYLMAHWEKENPMPTKEEWNNWSLRSMTWEKNHWVWKGDDPREVWEERKFDARMDMMTNLDDLVEKKSIADPPIDLSSAPDIRAEAWKAAPPRQSREPVVRPDPTQKHNHTPGV